MVENHRFSEDASPGFLSAIFEDASLDLTWIKIWLILWNLWICPDMLFFSMFVCNACVRAEDNPDRTRLDIVSQITLVQREKAAAWTTRP